jgi:DHA1 family bicyclomycin/chloramphenicol resistance-like MFS transporter
VRTLLGAVIEVRSRKCQGSPALLTWFCEAVTASFRYPHGITCALIPVIRFAVILGVLSAIGPLAIDMYLPAFPAIARSMHVGESQIQLSMISYFLAFAVGQLFYGPVSDRFGRKIPLLVGYAIYLSASVGAALLVNIESLIAMRFLQGLGACSGMAIGRSIVRDLGSGPDGARLFAMMALVIGLSPILAPSLGSFLLTMFSWTSIFWFMAAFSLLCILSIWFGLPETHPSAHRAYRLHTAFTAYSRLLQNRRFVTLISVGAFAQAGFFVYLSGSPFVLMTLHGIDPRAYGVLFGLNAISLISGSQLAAPLLRIARAEVIVLLTVTLYALLALLLLIATLAGLDSLPVTVVLLFLLVGALGTLNPITQMMAIEDHAKQAGAASALMGATQMGMGAFASSALSVVHAHSARPLAAVIFACACLALLATALSHNSPGNGSDRNR